MKLEDQVCSLELAKKLVELDVEVEPYFCWYEIDDRYTTLNHDTVGEVRWVVGQYIKGEYASEWYPAYTVAELGELIKAPNNGDDVFCDFLTHEVRVWLASPEADYDYPAPQEGSCFAADTEADARAKMLIYLIENNLMEV